MKCPQCGEKMQVGEMAYVNRGSCLLWTPKGYLDDKVCNLFTARGAEKAGGVVIPIGDGVFSDRTKGYACKACGLTVIAGAPSRER